ncbi:MAG TPA: hypothetical protein VLT83_06040 [Opitutaceae bacterium]|nr:hypothetical protein [Opitutaceae bacterium]
MDRRKDVYSLAFLIEFPTQPNREIFRRNRELIRRNREFSFGIRISEPPARVTGGIRTKAPSIVVATEGFLRSDQNQAPGIVLAVQDRVGAAMTRLTATKGSPTWAIGMGLFCTDEE